MQITHNWTTTKPNDPAKDVSKDNMNAHQATLGADENFVTAEEKSNLHAPHSDDQTIPSALADLSSDSTHRIVTDTQIGDFHAPHSDDQTIPSALADLSSDSTHRIVTDTQISNFHAPHSDDQTIPTALADLSSDATHRIVTDTQIGDFHAPGSDNQNLSGLVLKSGSLTQITTRNHTDLSDIGTNTHAQIDTALSLRLFNDSLCQGGTISYLMGYKFKWTGTFLVANYYQVTMPADTTPINNLGGVAADNWATGGIAMTNNKILLYQLPIGSSGSVDANFYLTDTLDPTVIPENCVIIATKNSTLAGAVRLGNGVTIAFGQSWVDANGFAQSAGDIANLWSASYLSLAAATKYDTSHANDNNVPFLIFQDIFGDFVVNSGLFPTSANLSSTLPARLAAYVKGQRRWKNSTTIKSFTASKDTYVDWDYNGTFTYVEVANGAGAPAVTANSIRLCKVVTSASAITSTSRIAPLLPFTMDASGNIIAGNTVRLKGYTVATLPAGTQGDTAFVTDALAPAYLTPVVGGGTVVVKVFFNGTNWIT